MSTGGAWDGDDYLRIIRKGLHNPTTTEVTDEEILGHYLQAAQLSYASVYRFPELEAYEDITTVVDQDEYDLSAANVLRVDRVEGLSDGTVPYLKACSRENRIRYGTMTGYPFEYFESSESSAANTTSITLVPTPDTAGVEYRVWYIEVPPVVTASGAGEPASIPVMGEAWNLALAFKSLEIGLPIVGRAKEAEAMARAAGQAEFRAKRTLPRAPERVRKPETRMAAATRMR